jgi:hypothetical protein
MSPICLMSDDEIQLFIEYWGNKLPDPEHEPMRFIWFLKLWKYYRGTL